jgi:hypothetical protein
MCSVLVQSILNVVLFQSEVGKELFLREKKYAEEKLLRKERARISRMRDGKWENYLSELYEAFILHLYMCEKLSKLSVIIDSFPIKKQFKQRNFVIYFEFNVKNLCVNFVDPGRSINNLTIIICNCIVSNEFNE